MAVYPINEIELESNELQSKTNFDSVKPLNEKPSAVTEGLNAKNSDSVKSEDDDKNNIILSETPNLYKQIGVGMLNSGFFSFPRSISSDPRYKGARLKYQKVLHVILENAAFRKTTYSIGSNLINIEVGQLCISVRGLVDLCNKEVKFKEDLIDKNIVERASHFWRSCQFVRQEVRHGKIIITVTVKEFYTKQKTESETASETLPRLNRDTKETSKTNKTTSAVVVGEKNSPVSFCEKQIEKKEESIEREFSKDDLYFMSNRTQKDWVVQEIEEAWVIFLKRKSTVGDPFSYIEGVINKKRNLKNSIKTEEKGTEKCQKTQEKSREITREKPKNSKEECLVKGMSGLTLADLAQKKGIV